MLIVSEDKLVLPFAFIITDKVNFPDNILISLSVDYNNPNAIANLTLTANRTRKVIIAEPFFIAQTGHTHFGEEAEKMYAIEQQLPLKDLHSPSDYNH